jgi:hypothetical protein
MRPRWRGDTRPRNCDDGDSGFSVEFGDKKGDLCGDGMLTLMVSGGKYL